ncbi:MAG: hypothetical protein PHX30_02870 [Candidatus Pacebacteria bacterium]|nr:hypothetical protein [Candidatus Paceibacterota bacterium]
MSAETNKKSLSLLAGFRPFIEPKPTARHIKKQPLRQAVFLAINYGKSDLSQMMAEKIKEIKFVACVVIHSFVTYKNIITG